MISPCVTFNDHEGSTKSYKYTRSKHHVATESDFVPHANEIVAHIGRTGTTSIRMHDGSVLNFTRVPEDYDVRNREGAMAYLREHQGEVVTGVLFVDEDVPEMHEMNNTPAEAITSLPFNKLCPGSTALETLMADFI